MADTNNNAQEKPEEQSSAANSNTTTLEQVVVTLSAVQQRAMRKLVLKSSNKKSASEQAQDWMGQKIKQAFKVAFKSDDVKKELEAEYRKYEAMQKNFNQPVVITLEEYIKRSMTEVNDIYAEL